MIVSPRLFDDLTRPIDARRGTLHSAEPGQRHAPFSETYLLILLATLFWGGTPVAGKLIIRDIPALTAGALRYGLTSLLLIVACWRQLPDPRSLHPRDLWILLWVGIFGTFLNHILFFVGLVFAPAVHASIIAPTTSPIWTMVLAARLGKERVMPGQVAGVILCLAGVVLVIHPERLVTSAGGPVLVGDLLFFLGGAAWGVYSYLSKAAMARLSAVTTLAFGMAAGTLFLVPPALMERPWTALPVAGPTAWGALAYISLAGTLLSFLWWNVALHRVGAGRTAIFTNLVPVFGVLLSWTILGERLTILQLAGGLLAVGGVLACQRPAPPAIARSFTRFSLFRFRLPAKKDDLTS